MDEASSSCAPARLSFMPHMAVTNGSAVMLPTRRVLHYSFYFLLLLLIRQCSCTDPTQTLSTAHDKQPVEPQRPHGLHHIRHYETTLRSSLVPPRNIDQDEDEYDEEGDDDDDDDADEDTKAPRNHDRLIRRKMRSSAFGANDYLLPENFRSLRRKDIPVTYR